LPFTCGLSDIELILLISSTSLSTKELQLKY
jgi:hypothetical protein